MGFLASIKPSLPLGLSLALLMFMIVTAVNSADASRTPEVGKVLTTFVEQWADSYSAEIGEPQLDGNKIILNRDLSDADHIALAWQAESLVDEFDAPYLDNAFKGSTFQREIRSVVTLLRRPVKNKKERTDKTENIKDALGRIVSALKENTPKGNGFFLGARNRSEPEKEWTQIIERNLNEFGVLIVDSEELIGNTNDERFTPDSDSAFIDATIKATEICRQSRVLYLMLVSLDHQQSGGYSYLIDEFHVLLDRGFNSIAFVVDGSPEHLSETNRQFMTETLGKYRESVEKRLAELKRRSSR
jgi:hypothetical protein